MHSYMYIDVTCIYTYVYYVLISLYIYRIDTKTFKHYKVAWAFQSTMYYITPEHNGGFKFEKASDHIWDILFYFEDITLEGPSMDW